MPELPEVETVCAGLRGVLEGRVLTSVEARRPDLRFPLPPDLSARLTGQRVMRVDRRAKYILVRLESGDVLIMHLGMSGRINLWSPDDPEGTDDPPPLHKHDHVVFIAGNGVRIVFHDPRRFGFIDLTDEDALPTHAYFAQMGPEPLSDAFTGDVLSAALKGKKTPIKAALLDQRVVAGLGNIYVCEALFEAGISPKRLAASVAGKRAQRLVPAIKEVLTRAIAAGGSTLRDYARVDGELGYFQYQWKVYDREGEPCSKDGCTGTVKRIVQSGRSTFYCPACQR